MQLDKAKDSTAKLIRDGIGTVAGLGPLEAMSLPKAELHFTLGAKQTEVKLVIRDLQASGPNFDQAFTSFCSQVSSTICAMSSEPSNIIQDSQEVTFIEFSTSRYI